MSFIKKKDPYEFWKFRDVRKYKSSLPKPAPIAPVGQGENITGLMSHHILFKLQDLPKPVVARFKKDLTIVNPEFEAARKYGKGFVSYAVPEFIRLYSIDTQYIGLPRSTKLAYLHKRIEEAGYKLELKEVRPEFEPLAWKEKGIIKPYFYQVDAIDHIVENNCVLKFRCGKGKSYIGLMAASKLGMRALIIVRNKILLRQWVASIKEFFDIPAGERVGVINGDEKTEGVITVATEQSLVAMSRTDLRRIGSTYGCVIIDEAHECGSKLYAQLMAFFKARRIAGLTATPEREDGMTPVLKLYIGPIVEVDDLGPFDTELRLRKTKFTYHFESRKQQYHKLIEELIRDEERNRLIVSDLRNYVQEGRIVVCYSSRIEHMETLEALLKEVMPGVKTDILASKKHGATMTIEEQESIRQQIKDRQIQVLNGGKMVEQGFDAPPLGVAVLATPTKSRRLIEQVLGRCQREYPGKYEAILHDYVDENTKVLMFQFYYKNRNLYKNYHKKWLDDPQTDLFG